MLTAIALAYLIGPCAQEQQDSLARLQAHYARVAEELAATPVEGLSADARLRRADMVAELLRYNAAADFGRGEEPGVRVPLFVDAGGRHCAVANLLRYSGEAGLVARVSGMDNGAWVCDLSGDPQFVAWLDAVGLTAEEAARIQAPSIPSRPEGFPGSGFPSWNGPGDTVPPGSSTGGAGESASGGAPEPSGPTGPATGSGPGPGPQTPAGGPPTVGSPRSAGPATLASEDFADWMVWWEFNKLGWLRPKPLSAVASTGGDALGSVSAVEAARRKARPLLQRELASPVSSVRAAAAVAYARAAGAEALPELKPLLHDPSREVRLAALFAFAATGSEEGVHALLEVVASDEEPGADLRAAAVVALGAARAEGHGEGAAGMLASLLEQRGDDDEAYALFVMSALGAGQELLGEAKQRSGLFERRGARSGEAQGVRARATGALSAGPASEVLSPLLDGVGGRHVEVRRAAALALGEVDGALAPLLTACELEREPLARAFALLSVGRQGGPAARSFLVNELEHGPSEARPWCALALGILAEDGGDDAACEALRAGYEEEKNRGARGAYLLALGIAGDREAEKLLAAALTARDAPTRAYAAQGLGILRAPGSRAALRSALAVEPMPLVRAAMAQSLALQGDVRDAELLLAELSKVQNPLLRGQMAAALGFHGSMAAVDGLIESLGRQDLSGESRAAALGALAVGLSGRDRMTLGAASAWADHAVFPNWFLEVLQQPL